MDIDGSDSKGTKFCSPATRAGPDIIGYSYKFVTRSANSFTNILSFRVLDAI